MRKLLCTQNYDEDLTGNDDFATVWSKGKTYTAVKHRNGTYTVETNQGEKGTIGTTEDDGYGCYYDGYFKAAEDNR